MEHKDIPLGERHAPHSWEFADEAERLAASGFAAGDVQQQALQLDDGTYWRLTNHSPVEWTVVAQTGPAGADGTGDANFMHEQSPASDLWTITHNMNKYPSVTVIDSGGDEVEGDLVYVSLNVVQITYSSAFAGRAYLN